MTAVIFGTTGGIGQALAEQIVASRAYDTVIGISRRASALEGVTSLTGDLEDEAALVRLSAEISEAGPVTLCIVATGFLSEPEGVQPERSYRQQSLSAFEHVFRANTFVPGLIAKHVLPLMPRDQRAVFAVLSARVGSISDNRLGGWHAYRASKAALNMLIRNYAIEQARRSDTFIAVGLHPGTVDTALSKPFQRGVPDKQLFTPTQSAAHLLSVIDSLDAKDSGKVFDWAGKEIPA